MPHPPRASRGVDADLAAVNSTADLTPTGAEPLLRRFLTHRNNLVVARAAKLIAHHNLRSLTPDLAQAFLRFLPPDADQPAHPDPQCWAKHELARTLAGFEYQPPDLFLAGLRHIQLEKSYAAYDPHERHPGYTDAAGPLRGTCALALVQCRDLPGLDLLRRLTPLFTDEILAVRVDGTRAITQLGLQADLDAAPLLLRLRAELGADQPELLAACIAGVLRLEGPSTTPWAAAFLRAEDDLAEETAFLLAEQRTPAAVPFLTEAFARTVRSDFARVLLTALAAMRLPDSWAFLRAQANHPGPHQQAAAQILADSQPPPATSDPT